MTSAVRFGALGPKIIECATKVANKKLVHCSSQLGCFSLHARHNVDGTPGLLKLCRFDDNYSEH